MKTTLGKKLNTFKLWASHIKIFFSFLTKKEKLWFSLFVTLFLVGLAGLIVLGACFKTKTVPAHGGILKEGVVGQPRFINPIYAGSNDVDRDLINLIYSGLFKYDINGKIIPDLAASYHISKDGKTYTVTLKKNIKFQDGKKLTADDIIFTVKTIQNPDFKSPLQAEWLGVKTKKIDDYTIEFILKNPYPAFLETLTLKILPAHIWEKISPQNFPLSFYNFKPIGSGPYKFQHMVQNNTGKITSLDLTSWKGYYAKPPYIQKISFYFFDNQKQLLQAARNKSIDALSPYLSKNYNLGTGFSKHKFSIPRYFAIFFNPHENKFLADRNIREALNYFTDKESLIKSLELSQQDIVNSPFLPNIFGLKSPSINYNFDPNKGEQLLENAGLKKVNGFFAKVKPVQSFHFSRNLDFGSKGTEVKQLQQCLSKFKDIYPSGKITGYFGNETKQAVIKFQEKYKDEILKPSGLKHGTGMVGASTRKKLNQICIISPEVDTPIKIIITTVDDPILVKTSQIIKAQWEKQGIKVEVESHPISDIRQIIKDRKYEALLFGQVLRIIPDPFAFWHSSQRAYPGLNLCNYSNKNVDQLLEKARVQNDQSARKQLYEKAQDTLLQDAPAVFLYNPDYIYLTSKKIHGIKSGIIPNLSGRFANITNWYIQTKKTL